MTRTIRAVPALLVLWALPWAARADDDDFVLGQAIVTLVPGASIDDFNAAFGTTVLDAIPERRIYLLDLPPGTDEEAFETAADESPLVDEAELDFIGTPADPGSDTQSIYTGAISDLFDNTQAFGLIGLPQALAISDGSGVLVALIDGGVDATHPVLAGRVRVGFNFVDGTTATPDARAGVDSNNNGFLDESFGHGTYVAGLLIAVAPGAEILPLQVMDSDGQGTSFRLARAIYAALDAGAHVANVSLSAPFSTRVVEDAVAEAELGGLIIVASSGNTANQEDRFPASVPSPVVLSVTSTGPGDVLSPFATFGPSVALSAPGENLVSTMPLDWPSGAPGPGYASASGTSSSAPLVAATAALMVGSCSNLGAPAVVAALRDHAQDVSALNPGFEGLIGSGRLDAAASLQAALAGSLACCPDLNADDRLNVDDVQLFITAFVSVDPVLADLTRDGLINVDDLQAFVLAFTRGCP